MCCETEPVTRIHQNLTFTNRANVSFGMNTHCFSNMLATGEEILEKLDQNQGALLVSSYFQLTATGTLHYWSLRQGDVTILPEAAPSSALMWTNTSRP